MEWFNFSAGEGKQIKRALEFIASQEVDLDRLANRTLIVKTENFEDACEEAARYFPGLGLESANGRLVFNTARDGLHKILINREKISGLSYIHALVTELVHLDNVSRYNEDHGNVYRLQAEQAIADHYYEFLLWSKFQAMRVATRVHALVAWHDLNGDAPPVDGRYQFAQPVFPGQGVGAALKSGARAETITAWRESLWDLLEELSFYFGQLAFYQHEPRPADLDDHFPAETLETLVGLDNCLAFYAALQRARDYPGWLTEKHALRRAIVTMQVHGSKRFESST